MKCPECGKQNRSGNTVCFYCGAKLSNKAPSWFESYKGNPKEVEYTREDAQGNLYVASDKRDEFAKEVGQLRENTYRGKIAREHFEEVSNRRRENTRNRESMDAISKAIFSNPKEKESSANYNDFIKTYRPRGRALKKIFNILLYTVIVVAIFALGYGAYSAVKLRKVAVDSVDDENKAQIITSILVDMAAHTIRIPGEEGQQIYVKELHKNFIVTNGYATVQVADYTWYESYEDYVKESLNVTLTPFVRKTNGKLIPLEPVNYSVEIPLSPLEIVSPSTGYDTIYTPIYKIEIKVRKNSKLWINGEEFSDIVNSDDGKVSYNAPVKAIGENSFDIVCKSQYSRSNKKTVIINRPRQSIPVDLDSDISSVSTFDYMTVNARTTTGTYITVQTPHTDLDITNIDKDGTFTFKAVFNKIGDNEIMFTASQPGKEPTIIKHKVYYVPDIDKYSRSAWAMDDTNYPHLVNTIDDRVRAGQKYVCIGSITEFIAQDPQLAIFNCGTEAKPLPVMLENKSKTQWEVGKTYRIYADAFGLYKDMPRLTARYTYTE